MEAFNHSWIKKFSKIESLGEINTKAIDTISTFKVILYSFSSPIGSRL